MSLEQKKRVNSSQMGLRIVPLKITGASGARAIADGTADATITAFAATGTYVITLRSAASRLPHIIGIEAIGGVTPATFTSTVNADKKTITVTVKDAATPSALDTDFHITIGFWDSSYSN